MYNELVWLLSGNLKSRDEGDGSMTSCQCTCHMSLKGFDGCTLTVYRPYPRTRNCEITSFTSGCQIAKGGKGTVFYSRIAVNDGKG